MDSNEARTLLGVERDASAEEIRSAYRATLKRWHPDRFAGDPEGSLAAAEQTRRIIAAYRALAEARLANPASPDSSDEELPSFWRQLNPFDASHYRYSPNTVWDGIAITGVIVIGIILVIVFGT